MNNYSFSMSSSFHFRLSVTSRGSEVVLSWLLPCLRSLDRECCLMVMIMLTNQMCSVWNEYEKYDWKHNIDFICFHYLLGATYPWLLVAPTRDLTVLKYSCEAQGKGRAKGRPRKVTQRSFIDCRWWMVDILSLMLYTKFGWNHIADCSTVLLNGAVLQWSSRLYAWSTAPPQVSLSPGLS